MTGDLKKSISGKHKRLLNKYKCRSLGLYVQNLDFGQPDMLNNNHRKFDKGYIKNFKLERQTTTEIVRYMLVKGSSYKTSNLRKAFKKQIRLMVNPFSHIDTF